ncbi:MAG: LON peptidase substrate-binding domain-containing protein [Anaerolineales bacterium]
MNAYELPLFPLNTVLFPGMPLHLHIFEDRYKKMINLCVDRSVSFGVVLIQLGMEANGPLAQPYEVGCTARILEVEPLSEGRMNVLAVGQQRFRTVLLDREKAPYLTGILESFPLGDPNPEMAEAVSGRLKPWVKRYLQVLSESSGIDLEIPSLPDEPVPLAYLASIALQVSNLEKQQLLSTEHITDLLDKLYSIYRREISILESVEKTNHPGSIGKFSTN